MPPSSYYHVLSKESCDFGPREDKTACLVSPKTAEVCPLEKLGYPFTIDRKEIDCSENADHVGVTRDVKGGNMPPILERSASYRRAVAAILHNGAALNHNANPCHTLQLERLYGSPVLLSGLSSLVLSKKEIRVLYQQHKSTLCRLQKLNCKTLECIILSFWESS